MPSVTTTMDCFVGSRDASKLGRSVERDDKLLEELNWGSTGRGAVT